MGKHVYHQILQHHLVYEKDVKWITNNDTHGYTWHMITTWWHLWISGGSDRCCQRCGWRGWRGWNRWNRWNRGTCTWTLLWLRRSKLRFWKYEIHETCFALKALRFSPFNCGKVSSMCIAPTYPFSKTKSIWIEPQVGGIDIWALQKLVTLHSRIQTTHRPQPKNPRPPQCGSIETPQKEGFIDLQHRAEQSVPISQFVKNQVGASQALPKKTLNIGFLNWMLWRKHCHKLREFFILWQLGAECRSWAKSWRPHHSSS